MIPEKFLADCRVQIRCWIFYLAPQLMPVICFAHNKDFKRMKGRTYFNIDGHFGMSPFSGTCCVNIPEIPERFWNSGEVGVIFHLRIHETSIVARSVFFRMTFSRFFINFI